MNEKLSADLIISNATVLTCRADAPDLVGYIPDGEIVVADDRIIAAGQDAIASAIDTSHARRIDANARVVMPGFVDCHTHVVFGGSRVDEYAARVRGESLQPLRDQGIPVGIDGTVHETRDLSVGTLVEQALPRLREMLAAGTTTVESKSGYALHTAGELRLLEANRELAEELPLDIISTLLGAHAVPDNQPRDRYIAEVVHEMIPAAAEAGLAEFCDVFCESGYFSVEESRKILEAGRSHGLTPKIHLDQYEHSGGAAVMAELGCRSADHLNFSTPEDIHVLAESGVVGVAMPGLDFAVGHNRPVDIRSWFDAGMTVALATDICPGCWLPSMQLVIALVCRLHQISPAEAVKGATLGAATAVGRQGDLGSLEPGKQADILILDTERYEDLAYKLGHNAVQMVIKRGQVVMDHEAV